MRKYRVLPGQRLPVVGRNAVHRVISHRTEKALQAVSLLFEAGAIDDLWFALVRGPSTTPTRSQMIGHFEHWAWRLRR